MLNSSTEDTSDDDNSSKKDKPKQNTSTRFSKDSKIRKACAELILSLVHCMKLEPNLIPLLWSTNLSISMTSLSSVLSSNGSTTPDSFTTDSFDEINISSTSFTSTSKRSHHSIPTSFQLFEFAEDLMSSHGSTGRVAKEAILTLLSIFKSDTGKHGSERNDARFNFNEIPRAADEMVSRETSSRLVGDFTAYLIHHSHFPSILVSPSQRPTQLLAGP
jgi:hypothetical protein